MKHHSIGRDQLSLFEEIEEEVKALEFNEEEVLQLLENNNLINFKKNIFLEAIRFGIRRHAHISNARSRGRFVATPIQRMVMNRSLYAL